MGDVEGKPYPRGPFPLRKVFARKKCCRGERSLSGAQAGGSAYPGPVPVPLFALPRLSGSVGAPLPPTTVTDGAPMGSAPGGNHRGAISRLLRPLPSPFSSACTLADIERAFFLSPCTGPPKTTIRNT